jgi:hypothetical protein
MCLTEKIKKVTSAIFCLTRSCPFMYMESTYLQSDLAVKVKMRTYIRLLVEGATF